MATTTVEVSPKPQPIPQQELCALCGTTRRQRGSLCWACDDEMERSTSYEFEIPNEPTCACCGSVLIRGKYCWSDRCMNWKMGVDR